MHRTQIRESDVTRQDKEKLVGMGSIAQVQRGEGQIPVAWSSQGATTVSVAGRSPLGCQALWRGKASVNKQGRLEGQPILGTRAHGKGRNRHRTPAVTRFHVVPRLRALKGWRGDTSAGGQSQVAIWPAGTEGNTWHRTGS